MCSICQINDVKSVSIVLINDTCHLVGTRELELAAVFQNVLPGAFY